MNIDNRALANGTAGHHDDSPTYRILHNPTRPKLEVNCREKNNPPSSMVIDDTDEGSKSSDNLENVYDGIQNVETTGLDNVGDGDAVKN